MSIFKALFSKKKEETTSATSKEEEKKFDILKYDGMRAQRIGRPDYAEKCYTQALELQQDFETMGYLAQLYVQTNRHEEARKLLQEMSELEPSHLQTRLNLTSVCYALEDYTGTTEAAKQALALQPENTTAYLFLAKAAHRTGDDIMSIAHLTKCIMTDETNTEARLLRAEVLLSLAQTEEAQKDIEAVLAIDEQDEAALLLRAFLHLRQGKPAEAEADYRLVIALNPFCEQAYTELGMLLIQQERAEEAIEVLNDAIEQNPSSAAAYRERGRAYMALGNKEQAAQDMKQSLELAPEQAEALNGNFGNQPLVQQTNVLGL